MLEVQAPAQVGLALALTQGTSDRTRPLCVTQAPLAQLALGTKAAVATIVRRGRSQLVSGGSRADRHRLVRPPAAAAPTAGRTVRVILVPLGQERLGRLGLLTAGHHGRGTAVRRGLLTAAHRGPPIAVRPGLLTAGRRGQATAGRRGQATADRPAPLTADRPAPLTTVRPVLFRTVPFVAPTGQIAAMTVGLRVTIVPSVLVSAVRRPLMPRVSVRRIARTRGPRRIVHAGSTPNGLRATPGPSTTPAPRDRGTSSLAVALALRHRVGRSTSSPGARGPHAARRSPFRPMPTPGCLTRPCALNSAR
jgi:hypothetical protein